MRCIPLPVNEAALDQFVRWGFLRADARHDLASIVQVFYKLANVGLAIQDALIQLKALRRYHAGDYGRIVDAIYSGRLHWLP
jgi:hypothetical protein